MNKFSPILASGSESIFRFTNGSIDIQAAGGDAAAVPTFSILAYSGGPLVLPNYRWPVYVDLRGMKQSPDGVQAFLSHDHKAIVGQADQVVVGASDLRIAGKISGTGPAAREVVGNHKNGFVWKASIGVIPSIQPEFIAAGQAATVNGRNISGPAYIARQSTLIEVSFVPIGADIGNTQVAIAAAHKESAMTFEQYLASLGLNASTITAELRATLQASFDAGPGKIAPAPASPVAVDLAKIEADATAAARKAQVAVSTHASEVLRICAEHKNPMIKVKGADGNESEVLLSTAAIEAGWDLRDVELKAIRAARPTQPIHPRQSAGSIQPAVIQAAMCITGGIDADQIAASLPAAQREQIMNEAVSAQGRGQSLHTLMAQAIQAAGMHFSGSHKSSDFIRAAFDADRILAAQDRMIRAAGGFSVTSMTGILSNVANKFLLKGFMAVDSSWRAISAIRSANDFKTITSYRLVSGGEFEQVGPGGALKHGTLSEESFTNKVRTYGKILGITEEDITNDDLGSITTVPQNIGRDGAQKFNSIFWKAFLDNAAFFATGNNNYISGGTSVLADAGLTLAVTKFMDQKDPGGKPLGLMPKILLVPNALAATAKRLYVSTNSNTGGASTKDNVPNANIHSGEYQPVVSPYLSDATLSGSSTTAWYLLGNPSDLATIEAAFLNGVQTPTIETAAADFDTLGIQMRGTFRFGVTKQEYRAGVKSAGA